MSVVIRQRCDGHFVAFIMQSLSSVKDQLSPYSCLPVAHWMSFRTISTAI